MEVDAQEALRGGPGEAEGLEQVAVSELKTLLRTRHLMVPFR
jgi:hypothetical protein